MKDKWYKLGQTSPSEENIMTILDPEERKRWKKILLPAVLLGPVPSSPRARLIRFPVLRQGQR